ncbi:selenocysteine-specific translation elongation factor [Thermodesulfobacteriota bacterium]
MNQIILGTAGHIDHGKTSLIKALSGIDTDRLKEEKERGITIELGFAHLQLPSGKMIGIVDVPGHEKFVKNMVAGATGIDLVAMVIAADEGVMPQTREHLEICQLLQIKHGLVILTKIDMVDKDWLELVRDDVSAYLGGSFLEDAPVVEASSSTGEGLEELLKVLDQLVKDIPEKDLGHIFRLPIDRVFTMKGFGTVITGTTVSGKIRSGEEVTIYPQEINSKIRGIQVHNKEMEEVSAGLRTAVNFQGLERAAIKRGNIVATSGGLKPTFMVDVKLDLLENTAKKLKNRAKVRFHTGTAEIISTVVLLDKEALEPGESCFAQLRFDEATAVLKNDRFVIRSYSPIRTIGGGEILNALPGKKKRFSDKALSELRAISKGELEEVIKTFVSLGRFQGVEEDALPFLTNTSKKKLEGPLQVLKSRKEIIQYDKEGRILIHSGFYSDAKDNILQTITKYHEDFPLKAGLPKEELRSKAMGTANLKLFNHLVGRLLNEEIIVQEKETVRLKTHKITLAKDQEQAKSELEEIYKKGRLQPPYFKEIEGKLPGNTGAEVLELMVKEGTLVKIKEDLFFHREAVEGLKEKLVGFLKEHGEITTPQFKEMTGASRKYTIPLIEYFDGTQVTVRVGDTRVLRKK